MRCKFQVVEVAKCAGYRRLKLAAVYDGSIENRSWSKHTPDGRFEVNVTNETAFPAIDAMNVGDAYYVDLTPVPEAPRVEAVAVEAVEAT